MTQANGKPIPPLIRKRDIKTYFHIVLSDWQLRQWEDNGAIHPFRASESSRALYRTRELDQILNGQPT